MPPSNAAKKPTKIAPYRPAKGPAPAEQARLRIRRLRLEGALFSDEGSCTSIRRVPHGWDGLCSPLACPKASARGRATTADVRPPKKSPREMGKRCVGTVAPFDAATTAAAEQCRFRLRCCLWLKLQAWRFERREGTPNREGAPVSLCVRCLTSRDPLGAELPSKPEQLHPASWDCERKNGALLGENMGTLRIIS